MLNQCQFIGSLGADPEVRRLQSGDPVVNLRLAVNEKWKDKNGERQERTTWVNIVIFSEGLCTVAEKYLKKGSRIFISGSLQTRKYQDQQGHDCYTTEIVLQKYRGALEMLDSRSGDSEHKPAPSRQSYGEASGGAHVRTSASADLDDYIPFMPDRH